jgi:hypothetical protein
MVNKDQYVRVRIGDNPDTYLMKVFWVDACACYCVRKCALAFVLAYALVA